MCILTVLNKLIQKLQFDFQVKLCVFWIFLYL